MQLHVVWTGRDTEHGVDLIGTGGALAALVAAAGTTVHKRAGPGPQRCRS